MELSDPHRHPGCVSTMPDTTHAGRRWVATAVGSSLGRVILIAAVPVLSVACSFNADPAVHPPRGLALPPPAALMAPQDPGATPAAAPVLAQASAAANAAPRAVPPGRPRR
jgi:4-amino-4-deoxy-L-arabinose transferase-like glycosyltransferase